MSDQPFAGIEVVEFGQYIAVPYCAQLLADGGAHVVKVEPLAGDAVRAIAPLAPGESRHFICRNRGKHSLPLDLRHPRAAPVVAALVARAGRLEEGLPAPAEAPIADYMCAMTLAFGIASALVRRAATGRGSEVNVSLLMAALALQNNAMIRVHKVDGPAHAQALARLAELRARGAPFAEQAEVRTAGLSPAMRHVYYRTYATRDAAIGIACVSPGLQRALMRAAGLTDEGYAYRGVDAEAEGRYYADLGARMEALMRGGTTAEWKARLGAHGIPASEVKLPIELLDDPQPLANDMLHDLDHPLLGPVRVVGSPVRLDGEGFTPAPATPPFASETRAILRDLGIADADIAALLADGVTRERPEPA